MLVFSIFGWLANHGVVDAYSFNEQAAIGSRYGYPWWYYPLKWSPYAQIIGGIACGLDRLATKRTRLVWPSLVVIGLIMFASRLFPSDHLGYVVAVIALLWGLIARPLANKILGR